MSTEPARPSIWRLTPAAAAGDTGLRTDARLWAEIIVRADSAAQARAVAGQLAPEPAARAGAAAVDPLFGEQRYRLERLADKDARLYGYGPVGVISATAQASPSA